jgi:hypothetical protein
MQISVNSFSRSSTWSTASNAFEMSRSTIAVRQAGFFPLNPTAILVTIDRSAVMVLRFGRYPCWVGELGRVVEKYGRCKRSRTFTAGERSEIGLYPVLRFAGLPGLGTGTTLAFFQMEGMLALEMERFYSSVRKAMPRGPKNFKWSEVRPSGPTAVELEDCIIAFLVSTTVKGRKEVSN